MNGATMFREYISILLTLGALVFTFDLARSIYRFYRALKTFHKWRNRR